MYFGSVKFFKHLIMAFLALMILIPVIVCFVLSADNSRKAEEIAALNEEKNSLSALVDYYSGETSLTFDDICRLAEENGITSAELVNGLYEKDKEAFAQVEASILAEQTFAEVTTTDDAIDAGGDVSESEPVTTTAPEQTTDEITVLTTGIDRDSPYADLYPELYATGTRDVVYKQDMNYVYLTFDDGPSKYTTSILYYLKEYNIKATFFVVPNGTEECDRLMKQIVDEGHTIAVHSATHEYKKIYASVESFLEDFSIAYNRIYEATGVKCSLFRFPGGSINDFNGETRDAIIAEMTRRGFVYFDWNVDSRDAAGATWTEMYNSVLNDTAAVNRAVILMHDHADGYNTILVLEDIIKALLNGNYIIDKLAEDVKPVQF